MVYRILISMSEMIPYPARLERRNNAVKNGYSHLMKISARRRVCFPEVTEVL